MSNFRAGTAGETEFLNSLVAAGLFIESGVPGVYGFNAVFIRVAEAIDNLLSTHAAEDGLEQLRFPPVLPKRLLKDTGYLNSFPHLTACLFEFDCRESDHGVSGMIAEEGTWLNQRQTDLALTPAACYPVYPAIAARGPLPAGGICIDTGAALVFRNEPSGDPARLQMFRQRELVRIAEPEVVAEWRDKWRERAVDLMTSLGLEPSVEVATDPFFGRAGRMMKLTQREQALKFEVLISIASPKPTAVASFNYHRDHFAGVFKLMMQASGPAHTACLGFGIERCTLALLHKHGLRPDAWPADLQRVLWR